MSGCPGLEQKLEQGPEAIQSRAACVQVQDGQVGKEGSGPCTGEEVLPVADRPVQQDGGGCYDEADTSSLGFKSSQYL